MALRKFPEQIDKGTVERTARRAQSRYQIVHTDGFAQMCVDVLPRPGDDPFVPGASALSGHKSRMPGKVRDKIAQQSSCNVGVPGGRLVRCTPMQIGKARPELFNQRRFHQLRVQTAAAKCGTVQHEVLSGGFKFKPVQRQGRGDIHGTGPIKRVVRVAGTENPDTPRLNLL